MTRTSKKGKTTQTAAPRAEQRRQTSSKSSGRIVGVVLILVSEPWRRADRPFCAMAAFHKGKWSAPDCRFSCEATWLMILDSQEVIVACTHLTWFIGSCVLALEISIEECDGSREGIGVDQSGVGLFAAIVVFIYPKI